MEERVKTFDWEPERRSRVRAAQLETGGKPWLVAGGLNGQRM